MDNKNEKLLEDIKNKIENMSKEELEEELEKYEIEFADKEISVGDYLFDNNNEILYRIIEQERFAVHLLDVKNGQIIKSFSDLSVLKSCINPTWSYFTCNRT